MKSGTDDEDPSTSGVRMTLALMSDCLGLPNSSGASGGPWPAVRVAVSGTALDPKIGWLGATRDAAALLLPGRKRRSVDSEQHADFPSAGGGSGGLGKSPSSSSGFSGSSQSHLLPWENQLQRSGGSRREETAGAPPGPSVVGRLERTDAKFSCSKSIGSSSLRIRGGGPS